MFNYKRTSDFTAGRPIRIIMRNGNGSLSEIVVQYFADSVCQDVQVP